MILQTPNAGTSPAVAWPGRNFTSSRRRTFTQLRSSSDLKATRCVLSLSNDSPHTQGILTSKDTSRSRNRVPLCRGRLDRHRELTETYGASSHRDRRSTLRQSLSIRRKSRGDVTISNVGPPNAKKTWLAPPQSSQTSYLFTSRDEVDGDSRTKTTISPYAFDFRKPALSSFPLPYAHGSNSSNNFRPGKVWPTSSSSYFGTLGPGNTNMTIRAIAAWTTTRIRSTSIPEKSTNLTSLRLSTT